MNVGPVEGFDTLDELLKGNVLPLDKIQKTTPIHTNAHYARAIYKDGKSDRQQQQE